VQRELEGNVISPPGALRNDIGLGMVRAPQ
jgi:hypothetical protein